MSDPEPRPSPAGRPRAEVRRVDERLGLAVSRLPLSARSLVNYTRDHVAVRTPSRPDDETGNTLDLLAPPRPEEVGRWVDRFVETAGRVGARRVSLRWEEPLAPDTASPPPPDPAVVAAAAEQDLRVDTSVVLLLDRLAEAPPAPAELVAVEPPAGDRPATDRLWHAATVLYRYASGTTPQDWRDVDDGLVAWKIEVQRELAAAGRVQVWLALRHGGPAARLTLLHDRQGLAGIHDLVVHPVQRRSGIGAALVHAAITAHLRQHPTDRVGVEVAPGSPAERLARRLGMRGHATVRSARGDRAGEGGG
jgi:GNAT superfamily N-acetyltransferase